MCVPHLLLYGRGRRRPQPPFWLVGVGLLVWCTSALVAGLARGANSYTLLLIGRMLSGVGEASFQVEPHAEAAWLRKTNF